jgi:hypothetical protein
MPMSYALANETEYENVFRQYLDVCNQAIERNKHKFPYTAIWNARLKNPEKNALLHAVVFDDRPKLAYMLRLTPDMKIEISEKKDLQTDEAWPFPYQYMKRVINHPEKYITNPARLQWGWLQFLLEPNELYVTEDQ